MDHGLRAKSKRLLTEELLFCSRQAADQVPAIPWEQLRDNPTDGCPS
jgi:hypothetical protein